MVKLEFLSLLNDSLKCKYSFKTIDKQIGAETVVQDILVDFDGKFSREVLLSIYFALCNGMPLIENDNGSNIYFSTIDQSRIMQIGNLNSDQIQLIHEMKQFVDSKLGLDILDNQGRSF